MKASPDPSIEPTFYGELSFACGGRRPCRTFGGTLTTGSRIHETGSKYNLTYGRC